MILLLCTELKKILVSQYFFKFSNYFFSIGTPTINKFDGGIYTGNAFLGLQVLVFETVLSNYKQIR